MPDARAARHGTPRATSEEKIRVLWLIKGLGAGGAERLLVSVARVADRDRLAFTVAYVRPDKDRFVADLRQQDVAVHCLGDGRWGRLLWPSRLRALLSGGQYDVVHLHSPLVGGAARVLGHTVKRAGRPVIVSTEHNTWSSYRLGTRLLNAWLYRQDAVRWAVSEPVRRSIWRFARPGVRTLVHGIVTEDFVSRPGDRERVRAELGIAPDEIVACTVANFRPEKAYPDLLAAAQHVITADPRVRFLAVGQGPLEPDIRALHSRLRLGDRFQLLGYRSDVAAILSAADVFVLASHFEGYPIAVMEALRMGLPVAATAVGGVPDAVEVGVVGHLAPARHPDLLAEAVLRIVTNDDVRRRMSAAARERGKQFDIRETARVLERAYLSAPSGGRRRGSPGRRSTLRQLPRLRPR